MKILQAVLILTQPAKSTGGDRYEAKIEGQDKPFVQYVPQYYSRQNGAPAKFAKISIEMAD